MGSPFPGYLLLIDLKCRYMIYMTGNRERKAKNAMLSSVASDRGSFTRAIVRTKCWYTGVRFLTGAGGAAVVEDGDGAKER